jgi:actin-related protein
MMLPEHDRCDIDIRKDLFCNNVLSEGTIMVAGFGEQSGKELAALAPSEMKG